MKDKNMLSLCVLIVTAKMRVQGWSSHLEKHEHSFQSQYFIYQQSLSPTYPSLAHLELLLTPGQKVAGFKINYLYALLVNKTLY